jgi:multicomponent Na+:H+ antiporter subunit C
MGDLATKFVTTYNYWVYIILMMVGLYAIIVKKNLVKKIIGINIVQTAIILFYISIGAKRGATIPIIAYGYEGGDYAVRAADYINPLPQVLMLTAIVVAVATLGVALSMVIKIYHEYGTLEEDDIRNQMREE